MRGVGWVAAVFNFLHVSILFTLPYPISGVVRKTANRAG